MLDFIQENLRTGNHHLVPYKGETVIELVKALTTLYGIAKETPTTFTNDVDCFLASMAMLTAQLKQYAVPVQVLLPSALLEEVFDILDWGDTLCNMGVFDDVTEESIYEVRKVTGW